MIVCEGKTEIGILRALDERWAAGHDGVPMATQGVALVDGCRHGAPAVAKGFASLGYRTALLMDSDDRAADEGVTTAAGSVHVVRWANQVSTEQRIAIDVPLDVLDALVAWACEKRGETEIFDAIRSQLGKGAMLTGKTPSEWISGGADEGAIRRAIGGASKATKNRDGWYRQIEPAEEIGALIVRGLDRIGTTDLAQKLQLVENWIYGA